MADTIKKLLKSESSASLTALIAVLVVFTAINDRFVSRLNVEGVIVSASISAIVSLGMTLVIAMLAALGAAIAFAPSWDSYTVRTAAGLANSITAGNSFANPGPVIVGDVAVMVTLVVVVALAALWRPVRLGAVLVAGAAIPMAAQVISALVQVSEPVSPAPITT